MKHTPGPWRVEGGNIQTTISAGEKHIAMVGFLDCGPGDPRSISLEERNANTALIAAAPELYRFSRLLVKNIGLLARHDQMVCEPCEYRELKNLIKFLEKEIQ